MRQVGEQRLAPRILVYFIANMAVEVAIRAFADAKRPVDVERQRLSCFIGGDGVGEEIRKRRHELAERVGTMADRMFELRIQLAEGPPVAHGHEHRVVAEAAIASRRPNQRAVDAALEGLGLTVVGPGNGERAGEMRGRRGVRLSRLDLAPDLFHGAHPVALAVFILGPARREDARAARAAHRRTGRCRRRGQGGR